MLYIAGFSQGATATALLLAVLSKQETRLKCAILVSVCSKDPYACMTSGFLQECQSRRMQFHT